jgi:hypothetical protein
MFVGAPSPLAPALRVSPRFPVVLHQDIPFIGIRGYSLSGSPEPLEAHLEPYRKSGKIRSQPLRPPDNPLLVIDELVTSPAWPSWVGQGHWGKSVAREQALRLVDPVYRVSETEYDSRLARRDAGEDDDWRSHLAKYGALAARWDPVRSTYVRSDGASLPPLPEPNYYPRVWRPAPTGGTVTVTLQRRHRKAVDIWLSATDAKPPLPRLRIYAGIAEIRIGIGFPISGGTATGFQLYDNTDVRLVLELEGKPIAETVLRP